MATSTGPTSIVRPVTTAVRTHSPSTTSATITMFRRSLRCAGIAPLPSSPERTDSDSDDGEHKYDSNDDDIPLAQLNGSSQPPLLPEPSNPLPYLAVAAAAAAPADVAAVVAAAGDAAAAPAPPRRRGKYLIMSDERRALALDRILNQRLTVAQVARTLGNGVSTATLHSLRAAFLKHNTIARKKKGGSAAK